MAQQTVTVIETPTTSQVIVESLIRGAFAALAGFAVHTIATRTTNAMENKLQNVKANKATDPKK